MRGLLAVSSFIDWVNEKIGFVTNLLVLVACVVSAGNAMSRYAFNLSSNAWLEVQWYMFAVIVMFGASYTLKRNEHVRVEIFYLMLSERGQLWLDLICTIVFLVPICLLLALQGVSEIIKRIAALAGLTTVDARYERPVQ